MRINTAQVRVPAGLFYSMTRPDLLWAGRPQSGQAAMVSSARRIQNSTPAALKCCPDCPQNVTEFPVCDGPELDNFSQCNLTGQSKYFDYNDLGGRIRRHSSSYSVRVPDQNFNYWRNYYENRTLYLSDPPQCFTFKWWSAA